MPGAKKLTGLRDVEFADDAYSCARGAHAVAIVTEWNEFRNMDLSRLRKIMRKPVLCDLRNLYDPQEVEAAGIAHVGVGRGRAGMKAKGRGARVRVLRKAS